MSSAVSTTARHVSEAIVNRWWCMVLVWHLCCECDAHSLTVSICSFPCAGIIAYFCPCYVFGKNAEAVGDSCLLCALSQFVPILNLWARVSVRGKIREQKGIEVGVYVYFATV